MALVLGTNSYISQADADAYFLDNLRNSLWTALSATVKDQALVTASAQISLFVREDCKLPLTPPIPNALANATAELGLTMAITPSTGTQGNTGSNVKRVRGGTAEVEFFRPQRGSRFPPLVLNYLRDGDCLDTGDVSQVGTFASGTDVKSPLEDETYDLTEGYP